MVRTRDLGTVAELRAGGATEVIPEALEGSLMIASQALLQLGVPLARVMQVVQAERAGTIATCASCSWATARIRRR